MHISVFFTHTYLEKSFLNICSDGKLQATEPKQNLRQIPQQAWTDFHTIVQRAAIVALGRCVKNWSDLGCQSSISYHRPMWHVKDRTGNMPLRLRDLFNNSIIPHLSNGSIIPVFQTWVLIQLLTLLLQLDTSQIFLVEKPDLCTRLPGKRNFVPVINHPEVLLEFL